MWRILNCLGLEHDWRLVVLAGIVCFLTSLAAVTLFHRARALNSRARAVWLLTAGAATGCGVWATHFIAILAYHPGVPVAYDIALTAVSLVAAVGVTSFGLSAAVYGTRRWSATLGGAIVGGGVACMHYLGMAALDVPGVIEWAPDLVITSIIVGMVLGAAAMTLAARKESGFAIVGASVLLTLSIVSHHFTAMGAVAIIPDATRFVLASTLSDTTLSFAIAGVAAAVLGMCLIGAISDRRSQKKISEQNAWLDAALNNMCQGLCMFGPDDRLMVWNRRYIEMYNIDPDKVSVGCTIRDLLDARISAGSFPLDPQKYDDDLLAALNARKAFAVDIALSDGRVISVVNQPMANRGWVATHEDITQRKHDEARIAHMAQHDLLTELPNRVAFNEQLAASLDHASKNKETFAILCLDLDRFKEVNDVFGHATGDALLLEVSRRLKQACDGTFLARLGGDEFIVISGSGPQPATAETVADRLTQALANDIEIDGQQLRIGITIGVSVYPQDGTDIESLMVNADAALYRAKAEARGSIRFFEPVMDKRLREKRALQHELRSAISRTELELHYQPQALIDGAINGFEALVRWRHPQRGLVPPGMFIPLAEESGLIMPLSEWILREACREAASWPNPLRIAINLSPVQFRHGDLPSLVHGVLLETGLSPGRLELEITEGVLIGDFSRAVSILRRLKNLGVRIAMDDFGTGYSSLSYLQAFPFDKIKIDQAFIANLSKNPQSAAIIRAVIGLGRGLDLPVVAEGVETKEQLAFLAAELCDEVQGFLIGRPQLIAQYADLVGRAQLATPATKFALAG